MTTTINKRGSKVKRYTISSDEWGLIINEEEEGGWVKYSDISSLIRSETCNVKYVVSACNSFTCIPCYEYYDCSLCDLYQRRK